MSLIVTQTTHMEMEPTLKDPLLKVPRFTNKLVKVTKELV